MRFPVAKTPGIRAVMGVNTLTDILIFLVLLLVGSFGIYSVWDNWTIESAASSDKWISYKPGTSAYGSFEEIQSINPEAVAWLDVYGTTIDYPVMYSTNPRKYLLMDPFGQFSLTGSLFIDSLNKPDFSDYTTLIYGHHMDRNLMFGAIDDFMREAFFEVHRYGKVFYAGAYHGLEIVSLIQCDSYDKNVYRPGIISEEEQAEYVDYISNKIVYTRDDVQLDATSRLLVLSTCSGETTNGRNVLVCRILDYVPEDPFAEEDSQREGAGLTGRVHGFMGLPWFFWGGLGLAGVAVLFWIIRRGRRGKDVDYTAAKWNGNPQPAAGGGIPNGGVQAPPPGNIEQMPPPT